MKPLSLIEKAFFLKKVKIFADLDLDLLLAVAEKLHYDEYDQNEQVFALNQAANRMYLIVQGSVQILDEQMRPLCDLTARGIFLETNPSSMSSPEVILPSAKATPT